MSVRLIFQGNYRLFRALLLAGGAGVIVLAAAVGILALLPFPHTRAHYLIAGSSPALAGLIALLAHARWECIRMRRWAARDSGENGRE